MVVMPLPYAGITGWVSSDGCKGSFRTSRTGISGR
jgi:hypothetical protein